MMHEMSDVGAMAFDVACLGLSVELPEVVAQSLPVQMPAELGAALCIRDARLECWKRGVEWTEMDEVAAEAAIAEAQA